MSLLGLDVGTTGSKAVVFDEQGRLLSSAYREYPLRHPRPEYNELDPEEVWAAAKEALGEAARGAGRDRVTALSISAQGEAFTPVSRDGRVLGPAIVTFDPRGEEGARELREKLGFERIMGITGHAASGIHTLPKIMWWKRHRPEVYEKTWKFLCFEDFVIWRLGCEPTIDHSLAARMMCFDVVKRRWSAEMLEAAGVSPDLLPAVAPSGTVVGEVASALAEELSLAPGCKVVTGGHDQPCCALGAGITGASVAADTTGTVECITPVFSEPVLTEAMARNNFACYPHVAPGMYVTLAFNFTGGSLLRWYRDNFAHPEVERARREGKDPYDLIIAGFPEGPTGLLVLPHFAMTGTPYMDPAPHSAVLGMTLSTTRCEFAKALLEGVTYEMRLNLERLAQAGVEVRELRAIGGAAKSPVWLQLKADIFGIPVTALDVSEAGSLGTAMLAGWATGVYADLEEAVEVCVRTGKTFEPDAGRAAAYSEIFGRYRRLYEAVKGIYA